jgi:cell division protein FtsQ
MKKFLRILEIAGWILMSAGLFALLGYTNSEHTYSKCKDVIITIDYGMSDTLINKADVMRILKQTGSLVRGEAIGYLNPEKIEAEIRNQAYVSAAQVFISMEGILEINIIQRQPILRVFNLKNESYYLDGLGNVLPVNTEFSARVVVASGNIGEPFFRNVNYLKDTLRAKDSILYKSTLINLFRIASYIQGDRFLKAQIEQIYVDKAGEFELVPRVGNHIILFGDAEDIKAKFDKLMVFYRKGLTKTGWSKYNVINIKYKKQVICSKI